MIVTVYNPKGGVGKTTTAVNLAASEAQLGKRVLLVDLCPMASASNSLGLQPDVQRPSVADVLLNPGLAGGAIRPVGGVAGLHVLTGSLQLIGMDSAMRHARQPDRRLGDAIHPLESQFEIVIVDSPPGFSVITMSALLAAQHLIVPVSAEYLTIQALAHFLRWYRDLRRDRGTLARLLGTVLTIVDHRVPATREIIDILRAHNRGGVFTTEVPRDPRAAEAPSHGLPVVTYAPRSRAAAAYRQLGREMSERVKRRRR